MTGPDNPTLPVGTPVPDWTSAAPITKEPIKGQRCDLKPLSVAHAAQLHAAFSADPTGTLWTYMPCGPFANAEDYADWVEGAAQQDVPIFYTIIDKASSAPVGVASYLRIQPLQGVVEVGWLTFAPTLQRSTLATEAMFLMMQRAFDLGYRRYEWKCDALNAASKKAATRLGFTYEGTFRQAVVYKGRNRDTAWFSIIDSEWPAIRDAFQAWLDPQNFDQDGQQRQRLSMPSARVFEAR